MILVKPVKLRQKMFRLVGAACLAFALPLASGCDNRKTYDYVLLSSKCEIVERMETIGSFMSDEYFSVFVTCSENGEKQFPVLHATNPDSYGVALTNKANAVPNILVFFCGGGRSEVEGNLATLNQVSMRTGMTFELSPARTNCWSHFSSHQIITSWTPKKSSN